MSSRDVQTRRLRLREGTLTSVQSLSLEPGAPSLLSFMLTGGVDSNEVACQLPSLTPSKRASVNLSATATSERAGILERLTVPFRDMSVTEKVALRSGSSQQGRARRASVGYEKTMGSAFYRKEQEAKESRWRFLHHNLRLSSNFYAVPQYAGPRYDRTAQSSTHTNGKHTHLELRQRIDSFLPCTLVVSGHTISQGRTEANAKGGFGTRGKLFSEYQGSALGASIELCLNWRKLCTRGDEEGRRVEV